MKKFFSIMCAVVLVLGVAAGQVFAQAEYRINGSNPLPLTLATQGPESCTTITVTLATGGVINTPLVTGGCWLAWDPAFVTVVDVIPADASPPAAPALPWDSGFTSEVPDAGGPGTYFLAMGNFGTVAVTDEIAICDVDICCVGVAGNQPVGINVITIPGFDTNVGDTTVWDPQIAAGIVDLTQEPPPPCCSNISPVSAEITSGIDPVADFDLVNTGDCAVPDDAVFGTDCANATIDPVTGILTADAGLTMDETCTVFVTDNANSGSCETQGPPCDANCVADVTIIAAPTCTGEIARGRECPGEEIDDPAYNRPGRRGLVATCGDIIDFTVCENCDDEVCLEWTIDPAEAWLTINQIDDCCWRLTIGDNCQDLEKTKEYEVTVTDTCNNWSDSVILEIGKLVIDLGDTAVDPQSGNAAVAVDLINPDHHVRALSFDVVGMGGDDNMVCTACTADPDRALQFTCSAAEQADGSCRVVMYATNPAALIQAGDGQVATILYDAIDPAAGDCVTLMPINEQASDQFNEDLCTCGAPGEVCFKTCGDIYPQDCIGGECAGTVCGDGVVDLFDILEAIDIILGLQIPTDCQIGNADVPNGMPPYCGNPPGDPNCQSDGDVDIFDVLVMIDKALGKANCCDYCNLGNIF